MTKTIKKIITAITATAIISGGLVVSFKTPKKLTMEEANTLRQIYTYEIQKRGGITLHNVVPANIIQKLQEEIEKTPITTSTYDKIVIDGKEIDRNDYSLLRSGLFKKALQKPLIKDELDKLLIK